jgi:glycosyltransferase involved in cell wall biosynthesis
VNSLPFVTVVIPALNEARVIGDCLRALNDQTYPRKRFEVVIVDNGSTDDTAKIAQQSGATVMHVAERSAYVARNAAIRATTGDYLAFTDADCVPAVRWIDELIAAESREQTGVVAGHIDYRMSFDSLGNRMLIASRDRDVIRANVCIHRCAPTGNVLIRRQLFEKHGLFCEAAYGSDIAMSKRLSGLGHPPVFAPEAVVVHQCDLSSGEYLARTFWNSRGNAVHDPRPANVGRLLHEAVQFPWRPGLRTVADVQRAICDRPPSAFVPTWMYMWLSRFASYAGRMAGTTSRAIAGSATPASSPAQDVVRAIEPSQHSV